MKEYEITIKHRIKLHDALRAIPLKDFMSYLEHYKEETISVSFEIEEINYKKGDIKCE